MFERIEIESFRGIRYASLSGFKRVNLFFGKNNCGKSSLLEALFLICGQSNPRLPINVNILRGYGKTGQKDISLDFYNLDTSKEIRISVVDGEERELVISVFESTSSHIDLDTGSPDVSSNISENTYGFKLNYKLNDESFVSELIFDASNVDEVKLSQNIDAKYRESLRCRYLAPKYDFSASIQGLDDILKDKSESDLLDALRIIEPSIVDFQLSNGEVLVDVGLKERIPINLLGDGIRKIFSLLTTIYDCRNGVVLIDEISNGFHFSVMPDLWKAIIYAARRNNTQLFVTTHDIDSIKGMIDAAKDSQEEIAAFKLLKSQDDELKSYPYTRKDLEYAISQDIEMR